ncbi:hypothetical protein M5K25_008781 [Dendrobium thyrsiflorum]|uniref:Uncharacterized protein n=1 Tax=Dendrobium thyrsiflorum TaxID=117978 RepID=A0ABD0VAR3_DENTH
MAQRLVSSKRPTKYDSAASCSAATAELWKLLGDLAHQPLKGKLTNEKLRALLVLPDLPQRNGSGTESMWLLDAAGCRRRLAGRLGGQLLPWCLAASRLTCGLLRSRHLAGRRLKEN